MSLREPLIRTIAVINGKGGVLKTSITANLSGLLAAADYRVLAIDLDPQANLGEDLGYEGAGKGDDGMSLFQSISTGSALTSLAVRPNLDAVPGGELLHDLAAVIHSREQRQPDIADSALAISLSQVAQDYDVVFIDCPPGQRSLQRLALGAARWALVPTRSDASSIKGLRVVARQFAGARQHNPNLGLLGVVLTGVTGNATRIRGQARQAIEAHLGGSAPVFESSIRYLEAAAVDARNRGQLVHELERDVNAAPRWFDRLRNGVKSETLAASAPGLASDYQRLAEELLERLNQVEAAPQTETVA